MDMMTEMELKRMMENRKGATMVTIYTDTAPDMRKTGNPYMGARKLTVINGVIGYIYDNAIINRAAKEGVTLTGGSKPHPWGDMTENHTLRINRKTGEAYLSLMCRNVISVKYVFNGVEITKDKLAPWLSEKSEGSSTQADLTEKIIVRDYKLANITAITIGGVTYTVSHPAIAPVAVPA